MNTTLEMTVHLLTALDILLKFSTLIAIILGGIIVWRVYVRFSPKAELIIDPSWVDDDQTYLLIKIKIKNISNVRIILVDSLLQILKYEKNKGKFLSEWVPFKKTDIKEEESPMEFVDPLSINITTNFIEPGETIKTERLHYIPENNIILHLGLQIHLESKFPNTITKKIQQETTTCIVFKK